MSRCPVPRQRQKRCRITFYLTPAEMRELARSARAARAFSPDVHARELAMSEMYRRNTVATFVKRAS